MKASQRAAVGRRFHSGVRGCQHSSPSLRNPTFHPKACGYLRLQQALWEGRGSGSLLGELQTPLTCAPSHPTHHKNGELSVHTQIFGINYEAGSQSSTGKGFSLEFIFLWKAQLGHSARPRLSDPLKGPL